MWNRLFPSGGVTAENLWNIMISSLEAQSEVKQHLIISFMSQESLEKHGEGNQAALHYGQNGMCLAYVLLSRMDMILYDSICFFWYLCFGSLFLWLMIVWLIEDANMSSLILNRCDGFISPPAGKCSKCFSNTLFLLFYLAVQLHPLEVHLLADLLRAWP